MGGGNFFYASLITDSTRDFASVAACSNHDAVRGFFPSGVASSAFFENETEAFFFRSSNDISDASSTPSSNEHIYRYTWPYRLRWFEMFEVIFFQPPATLSSGHAHQASTHTAAQTVCPLRSLCGPRTSAQFGGLAGRRWHAYPPSA